MTGAKSNEYHLSAIHNLCLLLIEKHLEWSLRCRLRMHKNQLITSSRNGLSDSAYIVCTVIATKRRILLYIMVYGYINDCIGYIY